MALSNLNPHNAQSHKISENEYEFLRRLVYDHCRINLGDNKKQLVMTRLSKRLRELKLASYREYIDLLKSQQGKIELSNLIDAISTNHTYFFRESEHFSFMMEHLLPDFEKKSGNARPFRIWSAACSSGEEPYSVAILLNEYFKNQNNRWKLECSDISTKILQRAKEGIFAQERISRIRKDWVNQYFLKGSGKYQGFYQFNPKYNRNLSFTHLNLMDRTFPFQQPFDLIFCRNVMIYFDRPTQQDLVNRMAKYLVPGGYLFIGHSESLNAIQHPLKLIKPAIYQAPTA